MLSIWQLILWQYFIVTVSCSNFIVQTDSGRVQGITQTTLFNNQKYFAFKGIPYAEPPVGKLRFKVPIPKTPWRETFQATQYGNACLVLAQSQMFPLNSTQSEDCLNLNIFTPVMEQGKHNCRKPVMFFIHGGGFTEGDNTDGFYGPDFIVEEDVVLVTINYRLGPWGFANFDLKGYTGNMGFKDQQLALEWVKRNIKYFGGDPNLITVFGESAGGASVHLHMLSERSRKCMKRAITMSGVTTAYFAHYEPNNHIQLFKKVFELDSQATAHDVLKFMLNAPADLLLQKLPAINVLLTSSESYFAAVIEDVKKADSPFLTRNPREIYKTTKIDVEAMFGYNSAEVLLLVNSYDPYSWIEPIKNYSLIGIPFSGLTLSPTSPKYIEAARSIFKFYFGDGELEPTIENLNKYVRMCSELNFIYPVYQTLRLHSANSKTFCYESDLSLNLNFIKITRHLQELKGTSHFEDLLYLFLSNKYADLYANVFANKDDPTNRKTLKALEFVPKMFTTYAKIGSPGIFLPYKKAFPSYIHITNDGVKPVFRDIRADSMKFLDKIYNSLKPWIVNPF